MQEKLTPVEKQHLVTCENGRAAIYRGSHATKVRKFAQKDKILPYLWAKFFKLSMNTQELLSDWPSALNGGFIIFLFCFFICSQLLGSYVKLMASMLHDLFSQKGRNSIFSEPVNHEFIIKILLILQTIILTSIIIYFSCSYWWNLPYESAGHLFSSLVFVSLLIFAYILYKFVASIIVGLIFFETENLQIWIDNFSSILSLSGLAIYIPALLIFYIPETTVYCFYFSVIYFVFVEILLFYKIYIIFFQQKRFSLHFILYLCTLEFVPLFLFYKALIWLFSIL
ncbi:hypothetical protein FACS1894162_4810 [Bacteroidia bacterium]|nr:hypothetical protein FACS1894162_4810 [Bacteroidia bacterium]